jgi:hypothetical protein
MAPRGGKRHDREFESPVPIRPAAPGFGQFVTLILSDRERFFTEVAEGEGWAPS